MPDRPDYLLIAPKPPDLKAQFPRPNGNAAPIQAPLANVDALFETVRQLKMAVDSLIGQTGPSTNRAVTFDDLVDLGLSSQQQITAARNITGGPAIGGGGSGGNPTAIAHEVAVNGVATTYMRSDAAPAVQVATAGLLGLVRPDNFTISVTGGVLTSLTSTGPAGPPGPTGPPGPPRIATLADVPPASPAVGDEWYDSVGGQLYIWFNDGTSSQWVPTSNQPGPQGPVGAVGPPGAASTVPGPAGPTGATGPAGPTGATGAASTVPGPAGPTGATGATGPAGSANITGAVAGQLTIAGSATSITSSIPTSTFLTPAVAASTYAPLASPALSGNPTAPTPSPGDADTSVATTAFVTSAISVAGGAYIPIVGGTITGSLTVNGVFRTGDTVGTGPAQMEIGAGRTGDGDAYIDFHSTPSTDYEMRLVRNTGANGDGFLISGGTGKIQLAAGGGASGSVNLLANGNFGIGTTGPSQKLHVATSTTTAPVGILASNTTATFLVGVEGGTPGISANGSLAYASILNQAGGAGGLQLATGNTVRATIATSGGVWINTAAPTSSYGFVIQHNTAMSADAIHETATATAGTVYHYVVRNPSGQVGSISANGATTSFNTSSDMRLKTSVRDATDLAALAATRIVDFEWVTDGTPGRGVLAQDQIKILPGMITVPPKGMPDMPWQADYSKLVPDLVAGWQAHEREIAALRAALTELTARLEAASA